MVSLWVKGSFIKSARSDNIKDTADYVWLNKIVLEEMSVRSKLLESVANRVVSRVLREDGRVDTVTASISKLAPPVEGDTESVSIKISKKRGA